MWRCHLLGWWATALGWAGAVFLVACAPTPTTPADASKSTIPGAAAATAPATAPAQIPPPVAAALSGAAPIRFQVLTGAETGLKKIIEDWAARELQLQGGRYADHGWWLWGLTAADLDNDGCPDLIPSHHGGSGALILRNLYKETGRVSFSDSTTDLGLDSRKLPQAMGRKPYAFDMDGNGLLDLVGIRSPHYFQKAGPIAPGTPRFEPVGKANFDTLHPLAIMDVSGDGYPDVTEAAARHLFNPKDRLYQSAPWTDPVESRVPPQLVAQFKQTAAKVRFWSYHYLTETDLNGDGRADVVVSGFAGYNGAPLGCYLLADTGGQLTDATETLGLPRDATPILLRDFTGDQRIDILTAGGPSAGLYVNDGHGRFTLVPGTLTQFLRQPAPYLHRAFPVDFNNDGLIDLVVSNPRMGRQEIYANRAGTLERVLSAPGWDSDPVAICDVNDDGRLDVCIGGPGNDITIYLNQTPDSGHVCAIYPRMPPPNPFAVGARVEVFRAGDLGRPGSQPLLAETAPSDASPVHAGLGSAAAFDLRVTFPGPEPKVVEFKSVPARRRIYVTPDGQIK